MGIMYFQVKFGSQKYILHSMTRNSFLFGFSCGCTFDLRDQVSHITNAAFLFLSHLNFFWDFSTRPNFSKICDPNLTRVQIPEGKLQQKRGLISKLKKLFL